MRQVAYFLRRFPFIAITATLIWQAFRPRFTAGVVGIIFNDDGHVLLVEHVTHPKRPWGLPGGWVDRAETLERTVVRELKEELQLDVQVRQVAHLEIAKKRPNHIDIAYLCTTEGQIGTLSPELLGYRWAAPTDLPNIPDFHVDAIQHALELRS